MRKALLILGLAALAGAPLSASDFAIYGSGWDPDAIEEALGGGASFHWGETFGIDLRATYYQNAEVDNIDGPFDDDETNQDVFGDLQMIPLEALLRFDFNNDGPVNFYLAGGASYVMLDIDNGPDLDDEVGWIALGGARFGDPGGVNFFVEGAYRGIEATVRADDLRDFFDDDDGGNFGDEIDEDVALNLDGALINLGVVWSF
jgi:opacity protein-like surface antigen